MLLIRQKNSMLLQLCHHFHQCQACLAPSLGLRHHHAETNNGTAGLGVVTGVLDSVSHSSTIGGQDSVSHSVMAGGQDSVSHNIMTGGQDSVSHSVMAGVHDSLNQSIMAAVQDSLRQSVMTDVQDSVTHTVKASVQDPVSQNVTASVQGSINQNVTAGIYSLENHSVMAGIQDSEARSITTGLETAESQSATTSRQDSTFEMKASERRRSRASTTTNTQATDSAKEADMNEEDSENVDNLSDGNPAADPGTTQHASEPSGATAKASLMTVPPGFSQGAVFLQIVDGKVCLQSAGGRTDSLGVERLLHTAAPSATIDETTSPVTVTAYSEASHANRSMLLYHLDTSDGLPFFVMDNCLQNPRPVREEPEEKHREKLRAKRQSSSSGTLKSSHSVAASSQRDVQTRKDAGSAEQPSRCKKQRTAATFDHSDARPKRSSEKSDVSQRKVVTVCEDGVAGGDRNTGNEHSVSANSSSASGGPKKRRTRTCGQSLRDQTNVRFNQLTFGVPTHKQSLITTKDHNIIPQLSRYGTVREDGDSAALHDESVVEEYMERPLSSALLKTTSAVTNPSLLRGAASVERESVQSTEDADPVHGGGDDPDAYNLEHSHNKQTLHENTASTSEQTEASSARYDPDFQNFLTSCFQSLDRPENRDERATTSPQGLVLLTSVELRFLASSSHDPATNDTLQKDGALRMDLPSVDTVCLMNVLRESSVHSGEKTPGADASDKHHVYPCYLFSELKSLILDSENSLSASADPRKGVSLPQQGYRLLPLLQCSSSRPLATDVNLYALTTSQNSTARSSTHNPDGTGSVFADSRSSPTGSIPSASAAVVNGTSPSLAEYNRLVESLLRNLASPGVGTGCDGAP